MDAKTLGELPADEMTVRQRMALEIAVGIAAGAQCIGTAIARASVVIADDLLDELARVR